MAEVPSLLLILLTWHLIMHSVGEEKPSPLGQTFVLSIPHGLNFLAVFLLLPQRPHLQSPSTPLNSILDAVVGMDFPFLWTDYLYKTIKSFILPQIMS